MSLSQEQKQTVATWVTAGDGLSVVQKKINEQFKISMTYRDVRFLVDDLNVDLKDPAPKVDATDVSKAQAAAPAASAGKKGPIEKDRENPGPGGADSDLQPAPADEDDADLTPPPAGASNVSVAVDKVTLIPGALASGTVTFSDGVTGKWVVDQYGRPGFTQVSKEGYRPSPADGQAFMQELSRSLQQRGF